MVQQVCFICYGEGCVIENFCDYCGGQGWVQSIKILLVKIFVGVDIGDCICLVGKGEVGMQGVLFGDLYVQVVVWLYSIFICEGENLYVEVLVSFVDVSLGGELEVLIFNGQVKLKVLVEIQIGKLFCLCGKGVILVCGGLFGDLLCKVVVEILVKFFSEQKDLLCQFQDFMDKGGEWYNFCCISWFEGVKCFFEGF